MNAVTMLLGAALLAVGYLAGRIDRPRRRMRQPERGPICGCKHHASYHEGGTGRCYYESNWFDPCTCRKYTGPVPLPGYYAPEIGE